MKNKNYKLPNTIISKLKKYNDLCLASKKLFFEIEKFFHDEDMDIEYFIATNNDDENNTEALTNISYGQGEIEENIKEIEKVYLYLKNKQNRKQV